MYTSIHTRTYMHVQYVRARVCIYVYIKKHTHAHTHMYVYTYIRARVFTLEFSIIVFRFYVNYNK